MKTAQISFYTRNCCIVKVPDDMSKEQITDFIINKIVNEDLENCVETWVDFEIEDFELE